MLRRWTVAALLGGVLFSVVGGGAAVFAFPTGPEWTPARGANPAVLAFLEPSLAGQVSATTTYLADPLFLETAVGYAVPDTGWGAAALVASDSRSFSPDLMEATDALAYSWARRWRPDLAAGVTVRVEQHQFFFDTFATPPQDGLGLDAGVLYAVGSRTWAGAVVRDVFDTTLSSAGGTSLLRPMSLDLSLERQMTPALRVVLEGRDVTRQTLAGTSFRLAATLERGPFAYRLSVTSGTNLGWSAGVRLPLGGCQIDVAATGAGSQVGTTVGVSTRW